MALEPVWLLSAAVRSWLEDVPREERYYLLKSHQQVVFFKAYEKEKSSQKSTGIPEDDQNMPEECQSFLCHVSSAEGGR